MSEDTSVMLDTDVSDSSLTTPAKLAVESTYRPAADEDGDGSYTSPTAALISSQLRVAREILFSPPVERARRPSMRWSAPLSPQSLEAELTAATKTTRYQKVAQSR